MRTLTNPISYWRAFRGRALSPGQAAIGIASMLVLVLISGYLWYQWHSGTIPLGPEFWTINKVLLAQVTLGIIFFALPGRSWKPQEQKKDEAPDLASQLFGGGGTVQAQEVRHNIPTRIGMWVQEQYKKVGGHENAAALVLALALMIFFYDFLSRTKILGLIPLGLCVVWAIRGYKDRRKLLTGVRVTIAVVVGLALSALTFGYQARTSGTVQGTFLASVARLPLLNQMGGWFGNDETTDVQPTAAAAPTQTASPTVVPLPQVEIFEPEHAIEDFTSAFSEGAKAELIQVVGYLNSAVEVVSEAEQQRSVRQTETGKLQALNTRPLLEGTATDTGVAESQSVVTEWYTTGVERIDGSYESTNFVERVESQRAQLEAEGVNIQALLETARLLDGAYKAFVNMLKALQVDEEGLVTKPNEARASFQMFQSQVVSANAQLELLGVQERVLTMDIEFVDNLLANEENRVLTTEVTATPQMRQVSEPVAELVAPSTTPLPLPTNTPVPTATAVPVGSITINVSFHHPYMTNVPMIGALLFQNGAQVEGLGDLRQSYPGTITFDNLPVDQIYDVAVFTDYPGLGCTGVNLGARTVGEVLDVGLPGMWTSCEGRGYILNNHLPPLAPTPPPVVWQPAQPTVVVNETPVVIQEVRGPIHVVVGINPRVERRNVAVVLYDSGMNVVDRKEVSDVANFNFENVPEGTYTVAVSVPSPNGAVSKCFVTARSGIPLGGNATFSYEVNDPAQFRANCL